MNPSDVQSDTEPRYFDPEEIDMSEQQFAASLDSNPEKPQFEIDEPELATPPGESREPEATPASRGQSSLEIPCEQDARCGEAVVAQTSGHSGLDSEPDWRSLVSAKVNSYKSRKPQAERYPSLKLQFEPPPPRGTRELQAFAPIEELGGTFEQSAPAPSEPILITPPPSDPLPPRIVMEATARVIEFPRPATRADELAEPMIDRPRIMEAPELLPPPPAMGGILIEGQRETVPERLPGVDVPLQSASLNRRVVAGLVDLSLVTTAVALFGYVFTRMNGSTPPMRSTLTIAVVIMAIFWSAYQYAFLVYCGRTPGLRAARLHLSRFDGQPASRTLRRWRVLASVLSLASVGLGYAWCFLDEDQLSWHDRITHTHLAPTSIRKT